MPKDKTEADLQKAAEEKAAQWYDFRIFVLLQVINFQKVKGGGLNLRKVSLSLQFPKKVSNHCPEHFPPKEIWQLFLEIGAKMKNVLILSQL